MTKLPQMTVFDTEVTLLGTNYHHGIFRTEFEIDTAKYFCEWSQYYETLYITERLNKNYVPKNFVFAYKVDYMTDIGHSIKALEAAMAERIKRRFFHGK